MSKSILALIILVIILGAGIFAWQMWSREEIPSPTSTSPSEETAN